MIKKIFVFLFVMLLSVTSFFGCSTKKDEKQVVSISVNYSQEEKIFTISNLDDLKIDLTINVIYSDNTFKEISSYNLSGILQEGTSKVKAEFEFQNKKYSEYFDVEVSSSVPKIQMNGVGELSVTTELPNLEVYFGNKKQTVDTNVFKSNSVKSGQVVYARSVNNDLYSEYTCKFVGNDNVLFDVSQDFLDNKNGIKDLSSYFDYKILNSTISHLQNYSAINNSDGKGIIKVESNSQLNKNNDNYGGFSYCFDKPIVELDHKDKIGIKVFTGSNNDFGCLLTFNKENIDAKNYIAIQANDEQLTDFQAYGSSFGTENSNDTVISSSSYVIWIDIDRAINDNVIDELSQINFISKNFNQVYIDCIVTSLALETPNFSISNKVVTISTNEKVLEVFVDSLPQVVRGRTYQIEVAPGFSLYARSRNENGCSDYVGYYVDQNYRLLRIAESFTFGYVPSNFSGIVISPNGEDGEIVKSNISFVSSYKIDGYTIGGDSFGTVKVENSVNDKVNVSWGGWKYEFFTPLNKNANIKKIGIKVMLDGWILKNSYLGLITDKGNLGGRNEYLGNYCYYQVCNEKLREVKSFNEDASLNGYLKCHSRSMILWIDIENLYEDNSEVEQIYGIYMGANRLSSIYVDSIIFDF